MSKNNLIDSSNILNLAKCCTRQSFYKERRVFFGILSTISAATFPSMTHDDKSISTSVVLLRFSSSSPQRNLNMGPCVWRNGEKNIGRCPKCSCGRIVSISELAMLDSWSLDSPCLSPLVGDHLSLWPLLPNTFANRTYKDQYSLPYNLTSSPESQLEVPHGLMNRNLDSGWYLQGSKKPESWYSQLYAIDEEINQVK